MKYTRQTGRPFKIRYQEHLRGSNTATINQNSHSTSLKISTQYEEW